MGSPLFNVRVSDELDLAITEAAEAVGVKKSVYAREVLAAVVLGGVTLEELRAIVVRNGRQDESPHPERYLSLQIQEGRRTSVEQGCLHPVHARKQLTFTVVCGVCGATVKRT